MKLWNVRRGDAPYLALIHANKDITQEATKMQAQTTTTKKQLKNALTKVINKKAGGNTVTIKGSGTVIVKGGKVKTATKKLSKKAQGVRKGFARQKLAEVVKGVVTPKLKRKKKADEVGNYNSGSTIRTLYDLFVTGKKFKIATLQHGRDYFNMAFNRLARHGLESGMWKLFLKDGSVWMEGKAVGKKAA